MIIKHDKSCGVVYADAKELPTSILMCDSYAVDSSDVGLVIFTEGEAGVRSLTSDEIRKIPDDLLKQAILEATRIYEQNK